MYLFIGDKNEIGIEFIFDKLLKGNSYYGYGKIWFGGNFLGTIEDCIYYDSYLLGQLQTIINCKELNIEKLPSTVEAKYKYFEKIELDEQDITSYRISTTTFTDMYQIFAYKINNIITIIWKVIWVDTFNDIKSQEKTIFSYQFEIEKLTHILKVLDEIQKINFLAEVPKPVYPGDLM